jgi:hypothetical protein
LVERGLRFRGKFIPVGRGAVRRAGELGGGGRNLGVGALGI